MEKDMLGTLVRKIADLPLETIRVLCDLVEKMLSETGHEWLIELKKFLRKEKCWVGTVLLKFLGKVVVFATTEKFVARDKFVVNTGKNAPVKISYLGDEFREWFLDKIEDLTDETVLHYAELTKPSVDDSIIVELGNTAETTLSAVYALMESQSNRKDGALLTNKYANLFYVRDVNGELRAVGVGWIGSGWGINASSVEHLDMRVRIDRVFFRNF
ncbi:MAG: hypothetical protein ABIH10_00590 [Spirochaetota bacterium]